MFFSNSRYLKVRDYTVRDAAGRSVTVKRARPFTARSGNFLYQVKQGDRLDLLANTFYRDPRLWWRIAEANPDVMYPDDLLEPGRQLVIPPAGGQ
jgi:nucleoid-associated protein YgaU